MYFRSFLTLKEMPSPPLIMLKRVSPCANSSWLPALHFWSFLTLKEIAKSGITKQCNNFVILLKMVDKLVLGVGLNVTRLTLKMRDVG